MRKELLSDKQGIAIVTLFMLGSSILLGVGHAAGRDTWITTLLSIAMAVPVLAIYARISYLYPQKNLYGKLDVLLGKYAGRALSMVFIWYAFHLGSLVTVNFAEFMFTVGLRNTPRIIPTLILLLLCAWIIKEGLEVLGRWSSLTLPILVLIIILTTLCLVPQFKIDNLKPVLHTGLTKILSGAFCSFSFPFAESIVFLLILSSFKNKASPYRIYLLGLLAAGSIIFVTAIRNISVAGPEQLSTAYYPSHFVTRRIDLTDFIQRLEMLVTVVFIFAGLTKISVCLMAVCKGIAHVLNMKDYRFIVTPVTILMLDASYLLFNSSIEMHEWINVYKYYAFPFQVILPIGIWIIAEIKTRTDKNNCNQKNNP